MVPLLVSGALMVGTTLASILPGFLSQKAMKRAQRRAEEKAALQQFEAVKARVDSTLMASLAKQAGEVNRMM